MNEQRNILNEKLQSIDHQLDSELLWERLEPHLPKERKRRRGFWWIWFGLGLAIVGLAFYVFGKNKKSKPIHEPALYAEKSITHTKETDVTTAITDAQIDNHFIKSSAKNTQPPQRESSRRLVRNAQEIISQTDNSSNDITTTQSKNDINTVTQSQPRKDAPQKVTVRPVMTSRTNEDVAMLGGLCPTLPMLDRPISVNRLAIDIVQPRLPRWSIGLAFSYGKNFHKLAQGDLLSNAEFNSLGFNHKHNDIIGVDLSLAYAITDRLGLSTGVDIYRIKDKRTYSIGNQSTKNTDVNIPVYNSASYVLRDQTVIGDLYMGGYYNVPMARWILTPELGAAYRMIRYDSNKSLDQVVRFEPSVNEMGYVYSNKRLGYYARLVLGYSMSDRVGIYLAAKYTSGYALDNKDAPERSAKNLVGQLGFRYTW